MDTLQHSRVYGPWRDESLYSSFVICAVASFELVKSVSAQQQVMGGMYGITNRLVECCRRYKITKRERERERRGHRISEER